MRKLRLDLDGLAVETFDMLPAAEAERGTVEAFASVGDSTCRQAICYYETFAPTCAAGCQNPTAQYTCAATCAATCGYTCDDPSCASCLTHCFGNTCYETCIWP